MNKDNYSHNVWLSSNQGQEIRDFLAFTKQNLTCVYARTHIHTHPLYESINEFSLGQMGEIMNFWHHQIIKNWVHFLKNVVKCALLNLI